MEGLDYWLLCDELSIIQAALLVAGEDPSATASYVEQWEASKRPPGYEAAKTAITNALRKGLLKGQLNSQYVYNDNGFATETIPGTVDLNESYVEVAALQAWLASRGFRSGFFFPEAMGAPDYLDPEHPQSSVKNSKCIGVLDFCGCP
jgi:hypothetical protein